MKSVFPVALLVATGLWAQAPTKPVDPAAAAAAGAKATLQGAAPAPAGAPATAPHPPAVSLMSLPPDKVVATVDGKQVTAGDLQAILRTIPSQQLQQQALSNQHMLLEQYGVARRLAGEAEKAKLDEATPWKEALANMRMQVLANAFMNKKFMELSSSPEDQKKYYEANQDRFAQAKVKAIYIKFSNASNPPEANGKKPLTEAEAKAKAEELVKQIRAGADFVKLVKENSEDPTSAAKDGDLGPITRSARGVPEEIKTVVFSKKPGEVTDPLRQSAGYYIFRVEQISPQPFEQVQAEIGNQLQNQRMQEWLHTMQKSIEIKMAGEPSLPLSPAPVPPAK